MLTANLPPIRQRQRRFSRRFSLPDVPRTEPLDAWLVCFENDLPLPQAASSPAHAWLARCLLLARCFLQGGRAPVFDAPNILGCEPIVKSPGTWHARFELAQVDDLPDRLYVLALDQAFKLATWSQSHPPDRVDRNAVYRTLQHNVLGPLLKAWPTGKSTWQVLRAAHARGIPVRAVDAGIYQLGWGARGVVFDRSTTTRDSAIGARLAQDKARSARLLRRAGLPAPEHHVVGDLPAATQAARALGWPVVVKPTDRDRGEGVHVDVGEPELPEAFADALERSRNRQVLIERQVVGTCHRLLVARGELLYAVKRLPIGVKGDGHHTVEELAHKAVAAQAGRPGWLRDDSQALDALAESALSQAGYRRGSVPASGAFVPLRRIETTAWGGVDEDVTPTIHADNVQLAVAAARHFALDVAGIDVISADITRPWHENDGLINEVNYAPLLGGAAISRGYLPAFLDRMIGAGGRIPIHVHVGDDAATVAAQQHWQAIRGTASIGPTAGIFCVDADHAWNGHGQVLPMAAVGLAARVQALLLNSDVHALLLVVQTDEWLDTGVPIEAIGSLHMANLNLRSYRRPDRMAEPARCQALVRMLAAIAPPDATTA